MEQGGKRANDAGKRQEAKIAQILIGAGYKEVPQKQFLGLQYLSQPLFARQFHIGKGIYDTDIRCDFIIYHPQKHKDCLIIESKNQNSAGSVDEKLPYLVENINERYSHKAIVIIEGAGFKSGAISWIRLKASTQKNLTAVYNMEEFEKYSKQGKL